MNGAAQAANSALTTASLEMKWLNGWSTAMRSEMSAIGGRGVIDNSGL
jgi:ribosome modulation factor